MQTEEIRLKVPRETAQAYRNAPPEEQQRIAEIVRLSLRMMTDDEAFQQATERLERTMDEIGARARARGLTDEILQDILNEKD